MGRKAEHALEEQEEDAALSWHYPPFRNHCVREMFLEELFSEELREIVAIDCEK